MNSLGAAMALAVAAAVTFPFGREAAACGHCPGDKIAAVYDGDVAARAVKYKQGVAYVDVAGGMMGKDAARAIEQAVSRTKGVQQGSVKVSESPAAARFVFDPRKGDARRFVDRMNARLPKPWTLILLKSDCPPSP